MRCVHSPTRCGWSEVQAPGSIVSKVETRPWIMLRPVTLAVMNPIVAAARATVEIWPMEITDDIIMLCSKTCVLTKRFGSVDSTFDVWTHPKTGKVYFNKIQNSSQYIWVVVGSCPSLGKSTFSRISGINGARRCVFSVGWRTVDTWEIIFMDGCGGMIYDAGKLVCLTCLRGASKPSSSPYSSWSFLIEAPGRSWASSGRGAAKRDRMA